jgi:uncharacterized protein
LADLKLPNSPSEKERWWAALSYVFSPILPAVLLAIFDLEDYPFLKQHIFQALAMGVLFLLTMPIILPSTLCIGGLFWLVMPYWCLQAYQGQTIVIPWITDWVKNQV